MTTKNIKIVLFASLMVAMILPFSVMDISAASIENTNNTAKKHAELQDKLGNQIHDLERTNEDYFKLDNSVATDQLITDNEVLIETLKKQYYVLSPHRELADISDTRRAELTSMMWKLAATDYQFLSMGINSYTGEINIRLDESRTSNINEILQKFVGDGIKLNIVYGENDIKLQGSCPNQTGECTTIIGASKGKDGNIGLDCTINIVATKGSGGSQIDGVVIPHHCNTGHHDYYQYDKSDSDQKVGPHDTHGGWLCDCDFVEIDSRASSTGKVNDDGSDISVTYGDLSDNDAVYMIGEYSGKDFGTIIEVNQWVWIGTSLFTDNYWVKDINFNSGDSGAPIIRDSDEKYGGMNWAAGTENVGGNNTTINYVHDWSFLKSKLGLN